MHYSLDFNKLRSVLSLNDKLLTLCQNLHPLSRPQSRQAIAGVAATLPQTLLTVRPCDVHRQAKKSIQEVGLARSTIVPTLGRTTCGSAGPSARMVNEMVLDAQWIWVQQKAHTPRSDHLCSILPIAGTLTVDDHPSLLWVVRRRVVRVWCWPHLGMLKRVDC